VRNLAAKCFELAAKSLRKVAKKYAKKCHFLPFFGSFSKNPYKTTHFP